VCSISLRLVEHANCAGAYDASEWLADFFKSPRGVDAQDIVRQFDLLTSRAARHATLQRDA
jgi:hypothetical protein